MAMPTLQVLSFQPVVAAPEQTASDGGEVAVNGKWKTDAIPLHYFLNAG